jgi:hypothetical protein
MTERLGRERPGSLGYAPLLGLLVVVAGCVAPGGWSSEPDGVTSERATGTPEADGATGEPATGTPATDGGEPTPGNGDSPVDKSSRPDALESSLYGLVTADDRAAYAETWNLNYRDGRVAVVVELQENRELPDEFDVEVRSRYEHLVQATVPVDELVALSEHENVSFVRRPREPATDALTPSTPTNDS